MSSEDNALRIIDFENPRKRVRWSDEINTVSLHHIYEYEPEPDRDNENCSMENETEAVSTELQSFELTEESKSKAVDCDNVKGAANSLPETCDDKLELIVCNKQVTITGDSCEVDCSVQSGENSTNSVVSDPPPMDYFDNNNSHMDDLSSLIYGTENMTITTSKLSTSEEVSQHVSSSKQVGACLPPDSNAENVIKQDDAPASLTHHKIKQIDVPSSSTRKRSLEGTLIERQTTRLNSCLKTNISPLSSAAEITSAAFNAWSKVKSESAKIETASSVPEMKVVQPKPSQGQIESRREAILKASKRKKSIACRSIRKVTVRESESDPEPGREPEPEHVPEREPTSEKRKSDSEEGKMAFRAWKKKKDELLNQQIAEKRKKEEKKRLDALMNERIRKSDAESAYLAWISHKAAVVRKEKKKSQWLLERENEKLSEKIKRNDEAAKIYYKWLRSKIFSQGNECHIITEDKPPWTPPGKANSLI